MKIEEFNDFLVRVLGDYEEDAKRRSPNGDFSSKVWWEDFTTYMNEEIKENHGK